MCGIVINCNVSESGLILRCNMVLLINGGAREAVSKGEVTPADCHLFYLDLRTPAPILILFFVSGFVCIKIGPTTDKPC